MENNLFNIDAVLRKNTNIDSALVNNHEKLEKELLSIGVDTASKYSLQPPLKECDFRHFNMGNSIPNTHQK